MIALTVVRPLVRRTGLALVAVLTVAVPAAFASSSVATKESRTRATPNVASGGRLAVRATRLSPKRIRVTFKLSATAKRDTQARFLAAPCTKGGCIDTGSRAGRAFALAQGTTTIVRTVTLRRASSGAIACVDAFAYDLGPDGANIRGTIGQAKVCPR